MNDELFVVPGIHSFTEGALTTLIIMCDASNCTLFNKEKTEKDEKFNNEFCDYLVMGHRDPGLML
jgi:hypothetical protein